MPSVTPDTLIQQIHAGSTRLVIVVTGGGSGAISALLFVPGASRSVLAAAVPYAAEALVEWLGGKPDEFCSSNTARAMAMQAYLKARSYDPRAVTCGVSCTASLASDRPKRGAHRAHLAWQTAGTTATLSVELEKGRRDRAAEEAVVTALVLNLVAEACRVPDRLDVPLLPGEKPQSTRCVAPQEQQDLLAGRARAVPAAGAAIHEPPKAVLSGAFNPLHVAHRKMAALAGQILGCEVAFELSILNVDKPPLDFIEIAQRVGCFAAGEAVWLSRAPHFTEKAAAFPGATFVVGTDTIARVADPRYYGQNEAAMHQAIADIAALGCKFLVFGRVIEGTFRTLADLSIPEELARICREVPESAFRDDISSTQLRAQARAD